MHFVALAEQELCKVRAILPSYSSDDCLFQVNSPLSFKFYFIVGSLGRPARDN